MKKLHIDSVLPMDEIVFVEMQKSRCNLTCHPLEHQGVRGHGVSSPATEEVAFQVALSSG